MRRLSIKIRVTLWFTAFMLALTAACIAFLILTGERMVRAASERQLVSTVEATFGEIEFDDGELEADDDLKGYTNGVYISVYDADGALIFGETPPDFPTDETFVYDETRFDAGGGWYIYDSARAVKKYKAGEVTVRGVTSVSDASSTFTVLLRLAMIALPGILIIAAAGGYLITARAFAPVRKITEAADRISDGKDLSRRIALGEGGDEIYTLAGTFDTMFDRLETSFEREKQFTSDASHELRTPVAVIISQCELALGELNDGGAPDDGETPSDDANNKLEEAETALTTVLAQAKKMSALISQLLTLARADKAENTLNIELVNLSALAETVAEQLAELAEERGITVETDIEPELLINGDETMLMRLLINLTENAVRYGRDNGRVVLSLHKKDGKLTGSVSDDGIGIDAANMGRIWERFYQEDSARTASEHGAGLGLPMVKWIAEAHGGEVFAESEKGRGSVFTFVLQA